MGTADREKGGKSRQATEIKKEKKSRSMPKDAVVKIEENDVFLQDSRKNSLVPPESKIDKAKFEAMCSYKIGIEDICLDFGISHHTLEAWTMKEYGMMPGAVKKKFLVRTKNYLIQTAIQNCKGNNALLIFLLKNLNGFADNPSGMPEGDENQLMKSLLDTIRKNGEGGKDGG